MSDALDFDEKLRSELMDLGIVPDPGSKPLRYLRPDGIKITFDEAVKLLQNGEAKRLWEKSQKTGF